MFIGFCRFSRLTSFACDIDTKRIPECLEANYFGLGSEGIERGAGVEEANFDFRPEEFHGLLHGLSGFASDRLAR